MSKLRKNSFFLFLALLALVSNTIVADTSVASNSHTRYTAGGTEIYELDKDGDLEIQGTFTAPDISISDDLTVTDDLNVSGTINIATEDLTFGNSGTAISTASTSGGGLGTIHYFYLGGDTDAVEGDLLVATTTVSNQATVHVSLASIDQTGWVGLAVADTSTGSIVGVYTSGVALARIGATAVNAGDVIVSTGAGRGQMGPDTSPTTGADIGVALTSGVSGLFKVRLR